MELAIVWWGFAAALFFGMVIGYGIQVADEWRLARRTETMDPRVVRLAGWDRPTFGGWLYRKLGKRHARQ